MRAGTRVKVEQVSKRAMRGPTHLRNGEGCPCCGSEILGCVHPPGLPLSPESHLWSPVFRCRLLSRLGSLPAGITVEGATPPRGGVNGGPKGGPFTPPRCRTSGEKGGALPPLPPPPVRRHDAPCEAGTRGGGAALRFTPEDSENPCQPASNAGFRAQPGPQRRGLRPLIVQICNCQNRAPLRAPPP